MPPPGSDDLATLNYLHASGLANTVIPANGSASSTRKSTQLPASSGTSSMSIMETLGLNVYLDQDRIWSASFLTRWLNNFEDPDTDVTSDMELVARYMVGYGAKSSAEGQLATITVRASF